MDIYLRIHKFWNKVVDLKKKGASLDYVVISESKIIVILDNSELIFTKITICNKESICFSFYHTPFLSNLVIFFNVMH